MIPHALKFGACHGDFPVVAAGNHQAVDPVDGSVARNDADADVRRADAVGCGIRRRAEFVARRAIDLLEQPPRTDFIHDFAALIRRAEHDDAASVRERMPRKIIADQNPAERVADEMDAGGPGSFTVADCRREDGFAQSGDGVGARGIINVPDLITGGGQGAFHRVHGRTAAAQTVQEDDVFVCRGGEGG